MADKVLVANRSEIACRIFQTCREMGLDTVGIVAPGDEEARHATYAQELVTVKNYLDIESVIAAAQASGAKYIHPGYGFLSERPAFAEAVERVGFIFLGPRAQTMELMGGKIAAKELAAREGVPTLPWARVAAGQDIDKAAATVGYPLLLKASAGGGGKGMRRVNSADELQVALESATAEATSAFGDGTVFLERLVEGPRHIEVQVFGDGRGDGVHLHERECSLQRRHQKIWEEAPAPRLSAQTRKGLQESALKLLRAVKYRSAGTIEFLVDEQGGYYFLEMNTRLQVEHPVTEFVTGLDLVGAQLELAMDPAMDVQKLSVPARGHAIEVRLYAEDPAQGFIPTPGLVQKLRWPMGPGIRVDSGIEEGQRLGTQFDSMMGKLIVYAADRKKAIDRMRVALEETAILGVGSNQSYLLALTKHPRVIEGRVDTGFLEKEMSRFAPELTPEALQVLSVARSPCVSEPATPVGAASPWTHWGRS